MTVTASVFNTAFEALFNRTAYLRKRVATHVPGATPHPSGVLNEGHFLPAVPFGADGFASINGPFGQQQQTAAVATSLLVAIPRPPTGRIIEIAAHVKGDSGHGALPATMPRFRLYRQVLTLADSGVQIAEAVDSSVNVAAYETGHLIQMTPVHTIASSNGYYIEFVGEAGANSQSGLLVAGFTIYWGAV